MFGRCCGGTEVRILIFQGDLLSGTITFQWQVPELWTVDVGTVELDFTNNVLQDTLEETFDNNIYELVVSGGYQPDNIWPFFEVWGQALAVLSSELRLGLRVVWPENLPIPQLGEEIR